MQQLAAENAERQRVALVQLQVQRLTDEKHRRTCSIIQNSLNFQPSTFNNMYNVQRRRDDKETPHSLLARIM